MKRGRMCECACYAVKVKEVLFGFAVKTNIVAIDPAVEVCESS